MKNDNQRIANMNKENLMSLREEIMLLEPNKECENKLLDEYAACYKLGYKHAKIRAAELSKKYEKMSDTKRLAFLMQEIDGFGNVGKDRYEYATDVAKENGHDEPTRLDELEGFRRLIDEAMKAS